MGALYTLLFKISWFNRPKLCYELGTSIISSYYVGKPRISYSDAEIVFSISNTGGGKLGVGKIRVIPISKYPLVINPYMHNTDKKIMSFVLTKNEAITIVFRGKGLPLYEKEKLEANIEIYKPDFITTLKKIPITINVEKYGNDKKS